MTSLTEDGFKLLKQKLEALKKKREALWGERAEAYAMGGDGWHDNPTFEFIEAEDKRLSDEIERLDAAFLAATPAAIGESQRIAIGSRVEIEFPGNIRKIFQIGDAYTADPAAGVISPESPLGKAVLGATEGDRRSYTVKENKIEVTVILIS